MSTRIAFTNVLSDQIAQSNGENSSFLHPRDLEGRMRVAWFSYTKPLNTAIALNSVLALTKLPAGARIIRGEIRHEAFGAGATASPVLYAKDGTAITSDTALGGAPVSIAATGEKVFGVTQATSGYVTPSRETVLGLKAMAAWPSEAATRTLSGFVQYVVD
jgi:hypothetical protein